MQLTEMRTRVRRDLRDTDAGNERWADAELNRHIERAVREVSLAAPVEALASLSTADGSRDLPIAALTDRVTIDAVEYPAGQYPPEFVAFSSWGDTLTLTVDRAPAAGESVTVYYSKLHTLTNDDSTLPAALEDVVATGAGGYAALEWASFATNRVNAGGADTWRHYHIWAQERLAAFARALARHGRERRVRSRQLRPPAGTGARQPGG